MTDPRIRYDIAANVEGEEQVRELEQRLDELGNTLDGDLAPRAKAAGAALRNALDARDALRGVTEMRTSVTEASRSLKDAEGNLIAYQRSMAAAGPPTRQMAANEQALTVAVERAQAMLTAKQAALRMSESSLTRYGSAALSAKGAVQQLEGAIATAESELRAMDPAWDGAGRAAGSSVGVQVAATKRLSAGLEEVHGQLRTLQSLAAVAIGGNMVTQLAKDVGAVADEYKNLSGRLSIVSGDGAMLQTSLQGVEDVALRTHSALEETGALFTRITKTGQDAGLSTQAAIEQSLSLTETINQAVQLSGASADSAKAGVTQLIQALQSGVLRGEEFNSIMEQTPRLAQALANGLGVTTGELR